MTKLEEKIKVIESVFILLGSNLGDKLKQLSAAKERIGQLEGIAIISVSSVYESDAFEMKEEQPAFLNQVMKASCQLSPLELLDELEEIERSLGRDNKGKQRARTIDLDILYFGQLQFESDRLTIPHLRVLQRSFAMVPMLEIEPQFIEPNSRKPLAEFLSSTHSHQVKKFEFDVSQYV